MGDMPWSNDLLDRAKDAEFLEQFLRIKAAELSSAGKAKSYVLNLDAGWGVGKTYFLTNFCDQLRQNNYLVAYIDAWADDHADDPLIAVMSAIEEGVRRDSKIKTATKKSAKKLAELGGKIVASGAKGIARQIGHRYLGKETVDMLAEFAGPTGASEITEGAEKGLEIAIGAAGKAVLERFKHSQQTIADFKKQLSKVLSQFEGERHLPLFVLVDELDRCRPTYAVSLLERVKHLFDVPGVAFVMATNTDQLQHSVAALYGSTFDGARYLHRFFDQTYRFEEPPRVAFVASLLDPSLTSFMTAPPFETTVEFIAAAFDSCNMPPRDMEQCIDILGNCVTAWNQKQPLNLLILLPLVIAQHKRLNPSFDPTLKDDLDSALGKKNLSGLYLDLSQHRRRHDEVARAPLWDTFYRFAKNGARGYEDLNFADVSGSSAAERFVISTLRIEATQRAHDGNHNPSPSLLLSYPALVRSVGRLVPRPM
jgi:hypothetical protein